MDEDNLFGGDLSDSSSDEETETENSNAPPQTSVSVKEEQGTVKEEKKDPLRPKVSFSLADDEESNDGISIFSGLGDSGALNLPVSKATKRKVCL
ncbi:unnamed protein product [Cylicostephanus goldi]|uniref:Uncharacterized protein n=1 Tax=Cylicostephanus goldi TaxID=71465 RepID=A0A3P6R613_CYLGO|nr:unnamed protein product [Cylicostephanus goldi]